MQTRIFRSGKGDAVLLSSDVGHILIDGGVPDAYEEHLSTILNKMRRDGDEIDLICVSHIDRDHIGGILEMLDAEMAWRIHDVRASLPTAVRPRKNKKPRVTRPPNISEIWHNAFFETIRTGFLNGLDVSVSGLDIEDIFFRSAGIIAGGKSIQLPNVAENTSSEGLANYIRFLGLSVGDAIEVSRRIGADQLDIPHNSVVDGKFLTRESAPDPIDIAGLSIHVLGPTKGELENLIGTWNTWLEEKATYLRRLLARHEREADNLDASSPESIISKSRAQAIEFARNEEVTPPNLASIILLIEDNLGETILLTGDADDVSILSGLEERGFCDANTPARIGVFKIPHHGADNSYSNELARRVIADHYVFCGNGKHSNPERRVINGYLTSLFIGADGFPPALSDDERVCFWFNCGPEFFNHGTKLRNHWNEVIGDLEDWRAKLGARFRYKMMTSGDSFLVT